MSGQQASAVDLLVSSELLRVPVGDEGCLGTAQTGRNQWRKTRCTQIHVLETRDE
jgi:hypothetical protein